MTTRVRLRPAPRWDPPYDEETGESAPASPAPGQRALPLTFMLPSGVPAEPEVAPGATSEVRAWTAQLAQAVVDVLAGDRPASQLLRWTTDEVQASVRRRASVAGLQRPRSREPRPRARVRSVRVCEPVAGVAEGSAVVSRDGRVYALALRLECRGSRWQCTALEGG